MHSRHKHGHRPAKGKRSGTYLSWGNMLERCRNKKAISFKNYGAKGIKVTKRWFEFKNFLEDMGERPTNGSIERIDISKGYYKENCKWIDKSKQQHNTNKTIYVTFEGVKTPLIEVYLKKPRSIPYILVLSRVSRLKWDLDKALNKPIDKTRLRKTKTLRVNLDDFLLCARQKPTKKRFYFKLNKAKH